MAVIAKPHDQGPLFAGQTLVSFMPNQGSGLDLVRGRRRCGPEIDGPRSSDDGVDPSVESDAELGRASEAATLT